MTALTQRTVSEFEAAPEPFQSYVLDFVLFVKARAVASPDSHAFGSIHCTPGDCGGNACVGMIRIAVWVLEDARRQGVGDFELLKDCPGLSAFDLEAAWQYVEAHDEEIAQIIQRNRVA